MTTTTEIADKIAAEQSLTKTQAKAIVESVFSQISEAARSGAETSIPGFGKSKVKDTRRVRVATRRQVRRSRSRPRRSCPSRRQRQSRTRSTADRRRPITRMNRSGSGDSNQSLDAGVGSRDPARHDRAALSALCRTPRPAPEHGAVLCAVDRGTPRSLWLTPLPRRSPGSS